MSRTARWIAVAAGAAALVVLFVLLRPGGNPDPVATSSTPPTTPTPTATGEPSTPPTTAEPTETPSTPDALEIEVEEGRVVVTVEGEPVAGDRTVTVTQGRRVSLEVRSDRTDRCTSTATT